MSDVVIKVENLGKLYRIGERERYKALRDTLTDAFTKPFRLVRNLFSGNGAPPTSASNNTIWALKDVSFEVKRGEVIGIIGRNGAGKSTLLKILSRITEPTEGFAEIRGRVGSLLEVGTGFHPELTGRENIYLNGAILGMRKAEIDRKFDEMVAFAEVEKFIDTPVKHYSSGMYVRLAFAVAAHLEPEILLVDEVLSVGDFAFQKKCLGKMGEVAGEGRTVLFVSHNMGAITRLCPQSIWLHEGNLVSQGPSGEVINSYQSQHLRVNTEWRRPESWTIKDDFSFLSVSVGNGKSTHQGVFQADEDILVQFRYLVKQPLSACQVGIRICNSEGVVVFSSADADGTGFSANNRDPGFYRAFFEIPSHFLVPGTYYLFVAAHMPMRTFYEVIEQAVTFEITSVGSLVALDGRFGIIAPMLRWNTQKE